MMLSAVALFAIAPSLLAQTTPVVTREWFSENVAGLQALPSSAQWTIDEDCFISNNVGIVVDDSVEYTPSRTSATNLPATVVTRLNFTVGDELPEIAAGSQLCLTACDTGEGAAYYVALEDKTAASNVWKKATGATPLGADTTVTVTNTFDYEAGTVSITVDGVPLSINSTSALPFNPMTNWITRLGVAGSGILGNISGTDSAPAAASVNGVNYATFDAAVAAGTATAQAPILLYANASYTFAAGDTLYVDENGFEFTTSAPAGYRVDYDGTVTYECVADVAAYTFLDEDGTSIASGNVTIGSSIVTALSLSDPTKTATAQYTYDFAGWTNVANAAAAAIATADLGNAVSGGATYAAKFTASLRSYTISWDTDGNGVADETTTVAYGTAPTHADGSKAATPQYTYSFTGWSPTIDTVTGDQTYTAQFSETLRSYTITWSIDGVDTTETLAYGATPSHADPTKASTVDKTYTFTGWSPAIDTVTGNQTYTAQFAESARTYTITWSIDGVDTTESLAYGATPSHADPTKAADAQYTYSFTGWSPEIGTVTGDQTYTAQFSQTLRTYTITWVVNGSAVETDENVAFGATPSYDGATPTKAASAEYTYTFNGWSPAIDTVSGDQTYTAQFLEIPRVAFTAALTTPKLGSTSVSGKTGTVTAQLTGGTGGTPTLTGGFNYIAEGSTAEGTFTTNWNAAVDWTLTASLDGETATLPGRFYAKAETEWFNKANDALDVVDGFGSAVTTGVNMTNSPSAAGQQVRINTRLEISVAESVPETGDSRGGFAVLKLAGDADAAYYAFDGTDWVKLFGAAPVASSEVDFFAVADMADKTVRYYVNGVALYTTNSVGAPVYPISLGGTGDSLEALGFSNAAGVKAAVVGEYDVPYVAAIGNVGYTNATDFVTALVAADKATANDVTVELLAHDIGGSVSLAYGEKVTVVNAGGYTNGPAFAAATPATNRIIETVDGNATIYTVSNTPVVIWHVGDSVVTADGTLGQVPVFDGRPTKARPDGRPGTYYKFRGWATRADGTPGDLSALSSMETEYYAIFELVEATFFLID